MPRCTPADARTRPRVARAGPGGATNCRPYAHPCRGWRGASGGGPVTLTASAARVRDGIVGSTLRTRTGASAARVRRCPCRRCIRPLVLRAAPARVARRRSPDGVDGPRAGGCSWAEGGADRPLRPWGEHAGGTPIRGAPAKPAGGWTRGRSPVFPARPVATDAADGPCPVGARFPPPRPVVRTREMSPGAGGPATRMPHAPPGQVPGRTPTTSGPGFRAPPSISAERRGSGPDPRRRRGRRPGFGPRSGCRRPPRALGVRFSLRAGRSGPPVGRWRRRWSALRDPASRSAPGPPSAGTASSPRLPG
ncbi:hypothetical protein HRbin39_01011 [bacterium HR39]|nr:hypothetical protein HRbin39_01011 [bacterium HR39]